MARVRRMSVLLVLCGLLLFVPTPGSADDGGYELKVVDPHQTSKGYTESFPTEVEATARLWNQIKVDAIDEQTRALRVEFEQFKNVRFQRQESLANQTGSLAAQYQPQPEHYPALMATPIRW